MTGALFLPGVPEDHVRRRLAATGGNEIESGKFCSPESSAALAANAFGWFVDQPSRFPPLPGTAQMGPAEQVDVEFSARFPWSGGHHPWLDALVLTSTHLIGVESKRFEPFRDTKAVSLSPTYDRPVWGECMARYGEVRDSLRSGSLRFGHLDAAQLVKHAYGLVTEGRRRKRRPILFYLFAEPASRAGYLIPPTSHARHREEIAAFAAAVEGDEVGFLSVSYREWITGWVSSAACASHGRALIEAFGP